MGLNECINQKIEMYYLVSVDHDVMAVHLNPELIVKGFKKCHIFSAVDETDGDMLWNGGEEDGNVSSECDEDEGTVCDDRGSDTDW